jgi:hypothetical protein
MFLDHEHWDNEHSSFSAPGVKRQWPGELDHTRGYELGREGQAVQSYTGSAFSFWQISLQKYSSKE